MEPSLFLNLKDVQAACSFARGEGWTPTEAHETCRKCPSSHLLSAFMDPHTKVLHPPPLEPLCTSQEGADGRCRRSTGLSRRDHKNIPAGATKAPACSDWGSACSRGTEKPQQNKGSLQGCVVWHRPWVSSMLLT